jgi:hypothetical protein
LYSNSRFKAKYVNLGLPSLTGIEIHTESLFLAKVIFATVNCFEFGILMAR